MPFAELILPDHEEGVLGGSTQAVLLVHHQRNIRTQLRLACEICGFMVHEAEHGQAALNCLKSCQVGVILTEMSMPVMDGREFLKQLQERTDGAKIPVVVFSNTFCPENLHDTDISGVDCWLNPPCRISTIQRVITDLLVNDPGQAERIFNPC